MFAPFPEQEAAKECRRLIAMLDSGAVKIEESGLTPSERDGHGIMLGVLVCLAPDGAKVFLKTVSGITRRLVLPENEGIFVEPIVSQQAVNLALKKNDREIHELTDIIKSLKECRKRSDGKFNQQSEEEKRLVEKRQALCNESLNAFYSLYEFHCADGSLKKLSAICGKKFPPTGTGDCCAPKLLDYAYKHCLRPLSMTEMFYGRDSGSRICGKTYGPCDERCALILPEILGLNILYRDDSIIVMNKQSGLLSVPGRGPEKQDCVVNRFRRLFPEAILQPSVHRLDMETSGLLVLAFTEDAHRNMNRQFENREVKKEYIAVVDGKLPENFAPDGQMELFFRVDIENRPHQIWDAVHGKNAVTEWHRIGEESYTAPDGSKRCVTRIKFIPHTGRTHQLRLAAADSHGFGVPIVGDTLYGSCMPGERLLLHSSFLSFKHPQTGELMEFSCQPDF